MGLGRKRRSTRDSLHVTNSFRARSRTVSWPHSAESISILESVRRLLRMGATPNLLNLLQKQHPADLAQIFAELPERERHATFNILVEQNGRLAMEALSELGPEKGAALLATAVRRGDCPPRPGDSVRRRGRL